MEAIDRLLGAYRRYGWHVPTGEWGAVNQRRDPLRRALMTGDRARLLALLTGCLSGEMAFGITTVASPQLAEDIQGDVQYWSHLTDAADLAVLRAPEVGQPVVALINDVPIMADTPRHDYHARKVMGLHPATVVEIGGGYGGFVLQLRRRGFMGRVYVVDLPETLYLSFPVLAALTPNVAWLHEDAEAATVLVPAGAQDMVPAADVVYSANALGEMPLATVHSYMRWLERLRPHWFYHQGFHCSPLITYTSDFPEVPVSEFGLQGYREVYRAIALWAGSQYRYWEFLMERA